MPRPPWSCTARSITRCAASVANIFAIAASRVTRAAPWSLVQAARWTRRADASTSLALSAIAPCVSCSSPSGVPKSLRLAARSTVSCNARRAKPSAAAPTVERKTSSVAIATLNPSPGAPKRLGCDDLDALSHAQSGTLGIDDERGEPFGAGSFPGAREHDVVIGNAAVGNPGFAAVDAQMRGSVRFRRGRERGNIRPRLRLGEREGGNGAAVAHRRQIARLEHRRAEQRDRGRAQTLHGECEVGQSIAEGQNLACETQRAHIELVIKATMLCRHDGLQEASLAERFHPRAAGRINIVMGQCRKRRVREMHKRRGKAAMALIEEWPGQRFLEAHAALPKNETKPCNPLRSFPRKRDHRGLSP